MTDDEVPEDVRKVFDKSVAFVVVLDLLGDLHGYQSPVLADSQSKHQQIITTFLTEYPTLSPTTDGFNPGTVVREEFEQKGLLDDHPQFESGLAEVEEWCATLDEPIELEPEF